VTNLTEEIKSATTFYAIKKASLFISIQQCSTYFQPFLKSNKDVLYWKALLFKLSKSLNRFSKDA